MKTKNYRNGSLTARGYCKPAGNGWEVGFTFGGKPLFCSNFVKQSEANAWWSLMNREIRHFSNRYKVTEHFPKSTYGRFLASHLYYQYYQFLDRLFAKHSRQSKKTVTHQTKVYRLWNRKAAGTGPRKQFLKAA